MAHTKQSAQEINLLAIFLITRSRPGPKLVFHYPPHPVYPRKSADEPVDADLDSDSDDENRKAAEDSEDQEYQGDEVIARNLREFALRERAPVPDEGILGYSVDSLENILCPGRWCDGKKFEMELDGVTFVGHPIYADQDGKWSDGGDVNETKQIEDAVIHLEPGKSTSEHGDEKSEASGKTALVTIVIPDTPVKTALRDFTHISESLESQGGRSLATSMNSGVSTTSNAIMEQMNMFHVVFACAGEARDMTAMLHQHVAKKISKALRHCQQQSNYVGVETRKLAALKAKSKQDRAGLEALLTQMLEGSELAWALMEVYERIRGGHIAGIHLNGMEMSLQVPLKISGDGTTLGPHAGLLLLQDKEVLLRELGHPDASSLAYFIREHTPGKSLSKLAMNLNLPLDDILFLAQHLIIWRKARTTAPLHQRNFYVAAKDAPLDQLPERAPKLTRRFPALPSLPQMLKMLSGKPIKYGLLIPSRDHRQAYIDLLAYLLRYGFVVQLKTSGWIRIPENLSVILAHHEQHGAHGSRTVSSLLSPHIQAFEDDNASVSSERTAIPLPLQSSSEAKRKSRQTPNESKDELDISFEAATVIVNPSKPSLDEARALEYIRSTIHDAELRENFPSLLSFLDGEHALEEIAAHKGMKRAKIESWLEMLTEGGHLTTFRHL